MSDFMEDSEGVPCIVRRIVRYIAHLAAGGECPDGGIVAGIDDYSGALVSFRATN